LQRTYRYLADLEEQQSSELNAPSGEPGPRPAT